MNAIMTELAPDMSARSRPLGTGAFAGYCDPPWALSRADQTQRTDMDRESFTRNEPDDAAFVEDRTSRADAPQPGRRDRRDADAPDVRDQRDEAAEAATPRDAGRARLRRRLLIAAGALIAILLIAGGILYWLHARNFATTSDAEITGNMTQMAFQVPGRVTAIRFSDNQHVTAGQTLIEIDKRDYQTRLDQALAQQQNAAAQVQQAQSRTWHPAGKPGPGTGQRDCRASRADPGPAGLHTISPHQSAGDHAAAARSGGRDVPLANRQTRGGEAGSRGSAGADRGRQGPDSHRAGNPAPGGSRYGKRQAAAHLHHDHRAGYRPRQVTAPSMSAITCSLARLLFALVQDHLWLVANFKETELPGVKPGQPVTIQVDAVPGITFHGKVDSFEIRNRLGVQRAAGGERDRQLGEGGAARSGEDRFRRRRLPQILPGARNVGWNPASECADGRRQTFRGPPPAIAVRG